MLPPDPAGLFRERDEVINFFMIEGSLNDTHDRDLNGITMESLKRVKRP